MLGTGSTVVPSVSRVAGAVSAVVPGVSSCFWEASGGALDGRPQAGFVTGDTCVGRLCAFFETGDASVEWKVAEMGCFRPTVVPVVA